MRVEHLVRQIRGSAGEVRHAAGVVGVDELGTEGVSDCVQGCFAGGFVDRDADGRVIHFQHGDAVRASLLPNGFGINIQNADGVEELLGRKS
ncbi:unannotated protein [freshwater metagenome]|uniref:Unannotated protein n=1 Tax=freshwater metagenome TaxID=449393 RepID=A0A6J6C7Q5_9ZZZZ